MQLLGYSIIEKRKDFFIICLLCYVYNKKYLSKHKRTTSTYILQGCSWIFLHLLSSFASCFCSSFLPVLSFNLFSLAFLNLSLLPLIILPVVLALDLSCCFRRLIFVLVQKREREKSVSVVRRIFVFAEREYFVDILREYCSKEILGQCKRI